MLLFSLLCHAESGSSSSSTENDAFKEAKKLWSELKAMRHDEEFINLGYSLKGKGGKWEKRRALLNSKWDAYLETLPLAERFSNDLTSAIYYMKSIGKEWWKNNGQDTKSSIDLSKDVERILSEHKG